MSCFGAELLPVIGTGVSLARKRLGRSLAGGCKAAVKFSNNFSCNEIFSLSLILNSDSKGKNCHISYNICLRLLQD